MGSCHHPLLIDESSTAENVRSAVRTVISEANLPGKFRRPRSLPTDDARPPTDTAGNTPTILSLLITLLNAKRFDSCEKFQQTIIFILQFVDSWLCSLEIITFLNKATTSYQSLKFIGDIPRHTSSDKREKKCLLPSSVRLLGGAPTIETDGSKCHILISLQLPLFFKEYLIVLFRSSIDVTLKNMRRSFRGWFF